jgi:putative hemolysin
MRRELFVFLIVILLGVLLAGCEQGEAIVTPTPGPAPVEPSSPPEVLAARRAVLGFLRESANECVPPRGVIWDEVAGVAPEGFDVYRFDSEGCLMTISYPLPESEETLYHVTLHNQVTGFCWQANVDAGGDVVETGTAAGMLPALSNAAAAYCEEQGFTYEEQDQSDGVRCGVCIFDDGESCNAWAYFQGMCGP